jgi:hypothetical protein
MIKRIILTLLQFVIFMALLVVGGYWDLVNTAFEMHQLQNHQTPHVLLATTHYHVGSSVLIANGLIFATVLLVLILLFLLLRRKLYPWAWLTVLAYVLAVCLGFAIKLGLVPADTSVQASVSVPHLSPEEPSAFAKHITSAHPIPPL